MHHTRSAVIAAALVIAGTLLVLLAQPTAGTPTPAVAAEAPARGARHLLRNGLDYLAYPQEHGRALAFLREAEALQADLNDDERRELRRGLERAQRGLQAMGRASGSDAIPPPRVPLPGAIVLAAQPARPDPEPIQKTSGTSTEPAEARPFPAAMPPGLTPPAPAEPPELPPLPGEPGALPAPPTPPPALSELPIEPAPPTEGLAEPAAPPEWPPVAPPPLPNPPVSPTAESGPPPAPAAEVPTPPAPAVEPAPPPAPATESAPPPTPAAEELALPPISPGNPDPAPAATEPAPETPPLRATELRPGGDSPSSLPPDLRREVERMAERQDRDFSQFGPSGPPSDLLDEGEPSTSRLELPRAPSPTEARPIMAIPVPEEFVPMAPRSWSPSRKYWAAAATCHTPLYFQDAALERYGQSAEQAFGPVGRFLTYPLDDPTQSDQRNQILQPFVSIGKFASQIVLLPYSLVVNPPGEAEYDLGYYRPGDRIPCDTHYLPVWGVGPPLRGKHY